MKFVCDRCGKKYATAGDPAPGKVYKLKCKACGHLIVVKGQSGTMTGLAVVSAAEAASATAMQESAPTPVPGIELHVEHESNPRAPLPTPPPGVNSTVTVRVAPPSGTIPDEALEPLPLPPEVALAVDGAAGPAGPAGLEPEALLPAFGDLPEAPPELLDPALTPPPPEKDELADFAAAAAEVMASPAPASGRAAPAEYHELFEATGKEPLAADPFTAAARGSLPDGWTGGVPRALAPEPPAAQPVASPALIRQPPPKAGLGRTPMAVIAVGVLALVGIATSALLGGGPPAPAIAAAPTVTTPPVPVRPPDPEPEAKPPAPVADAKAAEPEPEPEAAPPKPAPRAEPKPRPPERKAEKKPEPRPAERVVEKKPEPPKVAAAAEPRTETREVELPDGAAALTQEVVNKVVGANRKAFSTCIGNASRSGVALDGRQVALRITVNTNGTVTYPTLDDQSLNTTEMGQCLKSAARLMIFPKFKGDPFHYEVPLILSGN